MNNSDNTQGVDIDTSVTDVVNRDYSTTPCDGEPGYCEPDEPANLQHSWRCTGWGTNISKTKHSSDLVMDTLTGDSQNIAKQMEVTALHVVYDFVCDLCKDKLVVVRNVAPEGKRWSAHAFQVDFTHEWVETKISSDVASAASLSGDEFPAGVQVSEDLRPCLPAFDG
jgi:hypothetical protein